MIATLARWVGYLVLAFWAGVLGVLLFYLADQQVQRLARWWHALVWIELRDQPRSRHASRQPAQVSR